MQYILSRIIVTIIGVGIYATAFGNPPEEAANQSANHTPINSLGQLPIALLKNTDSTSAASTPADTQLTLSHLKNNRPLYLKFWASWCKSCIKEMPKLQEHYLKYGQSVQFLSVNLGIEDDLDSVTATLEQFGITVPTTIDSTGALARAVNFIGTPYHVVFDQDFNWVHKGYAADLALEKTLLTLSQRNTVAMTGLSPPTIQAAVLPAWFNPQQRQMLFFTTPWCEWYLADTRPDTANRCIEGQNNLVQLKRNFKHLNIFGVVTPLWTTDEDIAHHQQKYQINYPLYQDAQQSLFDAFKVKDFATLVVLEDGQEILNTSEVANYDALVRKLKELKILEEIKQ